MAKLKEIPPGVPPGDTAAPLGEPVKPPPFAATKPITAGGEIPRVVGPLERVPQGSPLARFRVSCHNYQPKKIHYILAESQEQAESHYVKVTALDTELARLKKVRGANAADVENPDIIAIRMPD